MPKQRNNNYMMHQNKPVQKGKRIFLEMRDSQLASTSGQNSNTAAGGTPFTAASNQIAATQTSNKVPSLNLGTTKSPRTRQLQQKVVSSHDDNLEHCESENEL